MVKEGDIYKSELLDGEYFFIKIIFALNLNHITFHQYDMYDDVYRESVEYLSEHKFRDWKVGAKLKPCTECELEVYRCIALLKAKDVSLIGV